MALRACFFSWAALCCLPSVAAPTCDSATDCAEPAAWHVSIASGAGFRSNPLRGGHNFPLWLMADVNYYGDAFFFDNGTFGYTLPTDTAVTISLVSRLNDEKALFRRASPTDFFESQVIYDKGLLGPVERFQQQTELSIADVAKRPWAVDAGVQLNYFHDAWQGSVNWWHDVNHAYQGSHARMAAQYQWQNSLGSWSVGAALAWKSRQLIDTYYGISADEWNDGVLHGQASWQPELSLQWRKELNERWSVLSFIRYRWLDLQVEDESGQAMRSPLQQDSQLRSLFLGFSYRFI